MTIQKIVKKIGISVGVVGFWSLTCASTVNVDLDEEHQVIRGFGGMVHNTWQGGNGLSEADADLAFGSGDGQLGLTVLRIPVNANESEFNRELAVAKLAQARGAIVYATPWTSKFAGGGAHISASNYQAYTDHLNNFAEYMKNQGAPLYAISFQNEPDWCGEWTCWSADEIYNYTRDYANQLRKHGTKVISAESFAYQKNLYNKVLNDANVLKNWDILGAHFYASEANTSDDFFAYSLADQKNVERWMTEHYTESQGSGNYWRVVMNTGDQANVNKLDTVRALDVGYEIHRAMVVGNFSQYTWWYIRRCYGLIMEKDFGNKLSIPSNEIGKVSKRGYVLSQFARFVRPGAIRVGATAKPEANVYASAYKSADGDSVIVVLINRDYRQNKTVTVNVPGTKIESFEVFTTSETKNALREGEVEVKDGSVTVTMNKDCIMTLVGVGQQIKIPREPFGGSAVELPGKIEAENFDIPGTGSANKTYNDKDSENHGDSDYRSDTGVDLYKKGTGVIVGYNQADEWLEYTINVKEAGAYTLFAAVASANATSSFQLSLDGELLTDVISVPQNEGEENYDDYNKVNANVTLPSGEHILRFTVVGDWMDVDYFTFVKGENAKDPEPIGGDSSSTAIENSIKFIPDTESYFDVFDLQGKLLTRIKAMNFEEATNLLKNTSLSFNQGIYLLRGKNTSKLIRLNQVK